MMAAGELSSSHFLCADRRHICKHVKGSAKQRRGGENSEESMWPISRMHRLGDNDTSV